MKKLLYVIMFSILFLSGCEKKTLDTAPAELFLMEGGETAAGVSVGDGPEEFIDAYSDYTIQVAYSDQTSGYLVMSIKEIPYGERISAIIATLFVDGAPVSEEDICEENQIEPEELPDLISSSSYLRKHDVVYRFLDFRWEDGIIADISSSELNYNETYEVPRMTY